MIAIDPQQEIFTALKLSLEAKGYSDVDGVLPPLDAPYPFVRIGDCQQIDDANKSAVFGDVNLTLHIWHNNVKQRGTVSDIALTIKTVCRAISHTKNFAWTVRNITQRILIDNSTGTPLLHGVVEVKFNFS